MTRNIVDFGEPCYVEAHGGKNHVILYRSKKNPKLAIEFFYRSSSKDGRSRYYRCTKCWYKYKINRGTCATLIVKDGRIVTDPENPVVPHQCEFRSLESVAMNRAYIAGIKRKPKNQRNEGDAESSGAATPDQNSNVEIRDPISVLLELQEGAVNSAGITGYRMDGDVEGETNSTSTTLSGSSGVSSKALCDNSLWLRIQEKLTNPSNGINLACDESLGYYSPVASPASDIAAYSTVDESAGPSGVDNTPSNAEIVYNNDLLDQAFTASMFKRNDEALEKLVQAIEIKANFDIDDISLLDNVFSYKFSSTVDIRQKISICEEWMSVLVKIIPIATSRWLSHYQFSIYYTFHMLALLFRHHNDMEAKKHFFNVSQPIFMSLLNATSCIPESSEEVVNTKLDVLLSMSLIAVQYHDVCNEDAVKLIENEMRDIVDSVQSNYSAEAATLMVQKVFRIGNNVNEQKRLAKGSVGDDEQDAVEGEGVSEQFS